MLIRKVVKITQEQKEMLAQGVKKMGLTNESEAIRVAIATWYRREVVPAYKEPSAKQREKLQEMEEQERIENMSDVEYAVEIMKARIFQHPETRKVYAAILAMGNNTKVIPIEQIKELDKKDSYFREKHFQMLAEGVDFDVYLKNYNHQFKKLGLDPMRDEIKKENENTNQWNNQNAAESEGGG